MCLLTARQNGDKGTLPENEPEEFFLAVFVQALKLCSENVPLVVQHETCVHKMLFQSEISLSVCLHVDIDIIHMIKRTKPPLSVSPQCKWMVGRPGNLGMRHGLLVCNLVPGSSSPGITQPREEPGHEANGGL